MSSDPEDTDNTSITDTVFSELDNLISSVNAEEKELQVST